MTSNTRRTLNKAVDALEKCSTPATRAGNTVERVGKLDAAGVPRKAIAVMMTERCNFQWTEQSVGVICDVYRESKKQVLVTASQYSALIDDYALDKQADQHEDAIPIPS